MDLRDDVQGATYFEGDRYESPTALVLTNWARQDATRFFDIGSNYGFFSYLMLSRFPDLDVEAFEPHSEMASMIESIRAANRLDHLRVHAVGLGDSHETLELHGDAEDSGHSTFGAHPDLSRSVGAVEVLPFDTWRRQLGLSLPSSPQWIAKIDVEGFEPKVLRGMEEALGTHAFKGLAVEVNRFALWFNEATVDSLVEVLRNSGYRALRAAARNASCSNLFFVPANETDLPAELVAADNPDDWLTDRPLSRHKATRAVRRRLARRIALPVLIDETDNFADVRWLGHFVWHNIADLWTIQETIVEHDVDLVIEIGSGRPGLTAFVSSILDAREHGRVLSVQSGGVGVFSHARVEVLSGLATDQPVIDDVHGRVVALKPRRTILILAAGHSADEVYAQLDAYASLLRIGDYAFVQGGVIDELPRFRSGRPGPVCGIERFLKVNSSFVVDERRSRRFLTGHSPRGWLRRIASRETVTPSKV